MNRRPVRERGGHRLSIDWGIIIVTKAGALVSRSHSHATDGLQQNELRGRGPRRSRELPYDYEGVGPMVGPVLKLAQASQEERDYHGCRLRMCVCTFTCVSVLLQYV